MEQEERPVHDEAGDHHGDQLRNLNVERDTYLTITRQLKTNKTLKAILENPETRQAFSAALAKLAGELQENI